MAIFHSYVSLPEGNPSGLWGPKHHPSVITRCSTRPSDGVGQLGVAEPGHCLAEVTDVIGDVHRHWAQRQRHQKRQEGAQQGKGTEGACKKTIGKP